LRTHSNRGVDVLCVDNALSLDDEEVEQLLNLVDAGCDGLPGDGPVLPGAHLGGKTIVEEDLANDFQTSSYYKSIVSAIDSIHAQSADLLTSENEV